MENEFVTYNQSLALKELGYDPFMREDCLAYFNTSNSNHDLETKDWWCLPKNDFQYALSAPLKSQVFEWFRDKHEIEVTIACFYNNKLDIPYGKRVYHCHIVRDGITTKGPKFKNYEEAELSCIDKLIEIVKNK